MKILAFPRDSNPYQELLYQPLRKQGVQVGYLEGPTGSHTLNLLLLPIMLTRARLQGYDTLHVHWTFFFALPFSRNALARGAMELWAAGFWLLAKVYGMRLVWTAHNARPHEPWFLNDVRAHRFLGQLADRIIVHTSVARQQLLSMGIGVQHMKLVPHGSYIGVHPNTVDRAGARQQLDIPADSTVILFFGQIRAYKGVEDLLQAFASLPPRQKTRLIIAGKVQDAGILAALQATAAHDRRIGLRLGHIPDDQLQYLFHSADYTVLPYKQATTSGVALLACSFGCPLIAPEQTAFTDIPAAAKIEYAQLTDGLARAEIAPATVRKQQSRAARAYAEALSWDHIAAQTKTFLEANL